MFRISRSDNILKCNIGKHISNGRRNNIGVFQAGPIRAQLFIIYADHIMKNKDKFKTKYIFNNKVIIKNNKAVDDDAISIYTLNDNNTDETYIPDINYNKQIKAKHVIIRYLMMILILNIAKFTK